jgi:hypothetical protein
MILKLPENREMIIDYLNKIDEDAFINEIIIPFFGSQGYQVYRINSHGPAEHGKDIIFYRYVPLFLENEFLVVQAKAEGVTTKNVTKFSDQLKRAFNTKFASRSGRGDLYPHYAIFINARKHSNDTYTEFPQLVDSRHAIILSQENVCELIMQTGIAPQYLLGKLSTSSADTQSNEDKLVLDTILSDNPAEIDNLLNHKLKFLKDQIGPRTKEVVLDYIYDRWQKDRSWGGTVKPMKWFNTYFDFFMSERHYQYFLEIFKELTSSTHSFDALPFTSSIVRKIKPEMLSYTSREFIKYCAERVLSIKSEYDDLVLTKLEELIKSKLVKGENLKRANSILRLGREQLDGPDYENVKNELESFAYPELVDMKRKNRERRIKK